MALLHVEGGANVPRLERYLPDRFARIGAWADDTQRGWAMILDVLDETLPADAPTCGAGLAQHAAVPRRVAIFLAELAQTLELHRALLVLDDTISRNEDAVYSDLASSYRDTAEKLREAADRMSAQQDLPMARTTNVTGATRI